MQFEYENQVPLDSCVTEPITNSPVGSNQNAYAYGPSHSHLTCYLRSLLSKLAADHATSH